MDGEEENEVSFADIMEIEKLNQRTEEDNLVNTFKTS